MSHQNYRILAIVPYLRSEKGHYHSFHLAANEAAASLGWNYIVAAPNDAEVGDWPAHWQKRLDLQRRDFKPRWLARFYEKHVFRSSLTHFLRQNSLPGESNILFIEDPSERMLRLLIRSFGSTNSDAKSICSGFTGIVLISRLQSAVGSKVDGAQFGQRSDSHGDDRAVGKRMARSASNASGGHSSSNESATDR